MHVSLDFDGVVADCVALKCAAAKHLYDKNVSAQEVSGAAVRGGRSSLTMDEYVSIQEAVYLTPEWHARLEPVKGAISSIKTLLDMGSAVCIVTARVGETLGFAQEWLHAHGVDVPFHGVGYMKSKNPYLKETDMFIDDDPGHVQHALSESIPAYVFAWPYNAPEIHEARLPHIESWERLIEEAQTLREE